MSNITPFHAVDLNSRDVIIMRPEDLRTLALQLEYQSTGLVAIRIEGMATTQFVRDAAASQEHRDTLDDR